MIIHTHVPRTAGTSLNKLISRNAEHMLTRLHRRVFRYDDELIESVPDAICGHVAYGIHKMFPNVDEYEYIAILRDPMERWMSMFRNSTNMQRSKKNHPKVRVIWEKTCETDIIKFLEYCSERDMHTNIMVKQLSGVEHMSNVIQDHHNFIPYMWSPRVKKYTDQELESMLSIAKDNMLNKYSFIGFKDTIDKDCDRLSKVFGWPDGKIRRHNRYKRKFDYVIDWHRDDVKSLLKQMNSYDIKLYDFALEHYHE